MSATETQVLDKFTFAYIEAALWSSNDDSDTPLDSNYDRSDLSPETLAKMAEDCRRFQEQNADLLIPENVDTSYGVDAQAGHDFWLTRNGHGCGFWDGDWQEPAATRLTEASKAFGECDLYIGDDGQIWL